MAFTAADVKKLREMTGAGMMDCKKALDEADGDFDKAVEILRVKGGQEDGGARLPSARRPPAWSPRPAARWSSSRARPTSSPRTPTSSPPRSRSPTPPSEAKPADVEALKAVPLGDQTVGDVVEGLAVSIGEKIELGQFAHFDGPVVAYMHRRAADLPPAVGVLVEYDGDADAARGAAMQIAAMRPQYLTRDEVPADVVAKEREIAEATAREEGKPEQAIAKIVEGRLNGFFKDVVLLDQPSVTENKKSVKAVLDEAGTTLKRFARFEVGA